MQAMFAQMVYKDRMIMELNNKILEQDRKVMDLQELAGEKQEVIRGRDKVIEVIKGTSFKKQQKKSIFKYIPINFSFFLGIVEFLYYHLIPLPTRGNPVM